MRSAVFLDRDGTVSEEVGYVNHIDRFRVFPWTGTAIRRLNEAGLVSVLVTNQSGVARGYFPEALVTEIHARLRDELALSDARLDAIYYCPHHPEGRVAEYRRTCDCRKPAPGMILRAAADLDLDLGSSFVISDRYQDLAMGFQIGARGILLLTGYGKGEYHYHRDTWARPPAFVAVDLLEASEWIRAQRDNSTA